MLDFSWQELAVTGVVALVVLGPKELPGLMRTAGQWARRAQRVAQEFRFSLDEMVEDAELAEARQKALTQADTIEPVRPEARKELSGHDPAHKKHKITLSEEEPLPGADPSTGITHG